MSHCMHINENNASHGAMPTVPPLSRPGEGLAPRRVRAGVGGRSLASWRVWQRGVPSAYLETSSN